MQFRAVFPFGRHRLTLAGRRSHWVELPRGATSALVGAVRGGESSLGSRAALEHWTERKFTSEQEVSTNVQSA
ncbi:hypothetical protein CHUV2995_01111 [Corynebacterium diphtheriae subsp. lausannense]|nr:hypothetical protein CHUV2995_01111 [Corynebacterium diphtheriae subsp. lausannense]